MPDNDAYDYGGTVCRSVSRRACEAWKRWRSRASRSRIRAVTVRIEGSDVHAEFTGTAAQARWPVNCPINYARVRGVAAQDSCATRSCRTTRGRASRCTCRCPRARCSIRRIPRRASGALRRGCHRARPDVLHRSPRGPLATTTRHVTRYHRMRLNADRVRDRAEDHASSGNSIGI